MKKWYAELKLRGLTIQITGLEGKDIEDAIKNCRTLLNYTAFDVTCIREHYEF